MGKTAKVICSCFIAGALALGVSSVALANQFVSGYTRSDGTYVQPYWRSDPDDNPYNNYSFPGNLNPYTGKTAAGAPDTYLDNCYSRGGFGGSQRHSSIN